MPFDVVAIPHAAYAALPNSQSRWLLLCLARYADREGRCWPSMRQIARDARMSKSSVQRYLVDLDRLGVFVRERRIGGRYRYTLHADYRPRSGERRTVPQAIRGVPRGASGKVVIDKHQEIPDDSAKWEARLRGWQRSRFWPAFAGPAPDEPGCFVPAEMLAAYHARLISRAGLR